MIVLRAAFFGSISRGGLADESDVEILVEFEGSKEPDGHLVGRRIVVVSVVQNAHFIASKINKIKFAASSKGAQNLMPAAIFNSTSLCLLQLFYGLGSGALMMLTGNVILPE